MPPCTGAPGLAQPDPCEASRTTLGNAIEIQALSSQASNWTIGFVPPQVTYPSDSGISLKRGDTVDITWTDFTGSRVKIHLFEGDRYVTRVTSDNITPDDGLYTWTIPLSLEPRDDYRIKIMSASDSSQFDFSDNPFAIETGFEEPTVTFPSDSGITVKRGQAININWTGFEGSWVKIQLFKGNRYVSRIGNDITENDGAYPWTVPAGLRPSDKYRIKIISTLDSSVFDFSDNYFRITR